MARKKTILIYPHLNDCGRDLSKQWYVEFSWRVLGDQKVHRERIYKGLSSGTAKQRYALAKKLIEEKTEWLKNGEHITGEKKMIYEDELLYRNEAKLYGKIREDVVTTRTNLSEFLRLKEQEVNKKTHETYTSKMRIFNAWLERKKLNELHVKNITRQHIIDFTMFLAVDQNLSKLTIKKYVQIVREFFDFELDRKNIEVNPVYKIPNVGKVVDNAATPYSQKKKC